MFSGKCKVFVFLFITIAASVGFSERSKAETFRLDCVAVEGLALSWSVMVDYSTSTIIKACWLPIDGGPPQLCAGPFPAQISDTQIKWVTSGTEGVTHQSINRSTGVLYGPSGQVAPCKVYRGPPPKKF